MGVNSIQDLKRHVGHKIVCVTYGKGGIVWNVALECETCSEVLLSFDAIELNYIGPFSGEIKCKS